MNIADQWDLFAALPFLAAAVGILYVATVTFGSTALRLARKQRKREREAKRREPGTTPWSEWLREINEAPVRTRLDDAEGKWRE